MNGQVIWITGLSGAGKTTVAKSLKQRLNLKRVAPVLLDGDSLRSIFENIDGLKDTFVRYERIMLAYKYARLCKNLSDQGFTVIIATMCMFNEIYDWNRKNLTGYFEVYLNVPMSELKRRDPKNIYKNFNAGLIKNVAGLDLKVDQPTQADLVVDFKNGLTPSSVVDQILGKLMLNEQG